MEVWTQFFGRLHPMVLHLPIGLILGWAALEAIALLRRVTWALRGRPRDQSVASALRGRRIGDPSVASALRGRRTALRGRRGAITVLSWLAAVSAVLSAATGFALSYEPGYGGGTLLDHQRFGIAVAVGSVLAAAFRLVAARRGAGNAWWHAYAAALTATVLVLLPAGHLGASMTHGPDFLLEPFEARRRPPPALAPPANTVPRSSPTSAPSSAGASSGLAYADVAPIFAERCGACHGPTRQRARLALHQPESIRKGGKSGAVLVPGDPAASELVRRLRLPLDDDAHMPPADEEQPTPAEIERIEAWIAAGAPFDGPAGSAPGAAAPAGAAGDARAASAGDARTASATGDQPARDAGGSPAARAASRSADEGKSERRGAVGSPPAPENGRFSAPSAEALAALQRALVHVEAAGAGSNALCIDLAAAASQLGDAEVAALLDPLRSNIVDLSLARTRITDQSLPLIARMENLRRLDLRGAAVTDAGLAALRGHARLEELVLAQTQVTDTVAENLLAMPALRRVYTWGTRVTAEGVARLHAGNAALVVDVGAPPEGKPLESEGELTFTGDAPLPGAAAEQPAAAGGATGVAAAAAALKPINATCPVSGKPVDPRFAIVHEGRVIGFCCPNCPQQFWSDPVRYVPK